MTSIATTHLVREHKYAPSYPSVRRLVVCKLLEGIDLIKREFANEELNRIGFGTTPDTKSTTNSDIKDKHLHSILLSNVEEYVNVETDHIFIDNYCYQLLDTNIFIYQ